MKWVIFALIIVAVVVFYFVLLYVIFKKILPKRADDIEKSYSGRRVLKSTRRANFFGKQSWKYARIKGNGILALFPEELVFYLFYPRNEYHMPLDRVSKIEHPKTFRQRSALRELLAVYYVEDDGSDEAVGILVEDPHDWADSIREHARSRYGRVID